MRMPYTVITRAMHIHPTVAEYMPTLLGNLEPLKDAEGSNANQDQVMWMV